VSKEETMEESKVFVAIVLFLLLGTAERWGPWIFEWGLVLAILARSIVGPEEEEKEGP